MSTHANVTRGTIIWAHPRPSQLSRPPAVLSELAYVTFVLCRMTSSRPAAWRTLTSLAWARLRNPACLRGLRSCLSWNAWPQYRCVQLEQSFLSPSPVVAPSDHSPSLVCSALRSVSFIACTTITRLATCTMYPRTGLSAPSLTQQGRCSGTHCQSRYGAHQHIHTDTNRAAIRTMLPAPRRLE